MDITTLLGATLAIAALGYLLGLRRAAAFARAGRTHSRSGYHAAHVLIWAILPALAVLLVFVIARPLLERSVVLAEFPETLIADDSQAALTLGVVSQVAEGLTRLTDAELDQLRIGVVAARPLLAARGVALGGDVDATTLRAAKALNATSATIVTARAFAMLAAAVAGAALALRQLSPGFRARNTVEGVLLGILVAASTVAILTTLGIVVSLVHESIQFFSKVHPFDFYFGTVWDPRFALAGAPGAQGQFGLLPLMWGTLYISVIALLIAVPVGLFAAIYMSEYAPRSVRAVAKPLLEVLAGIPTIVYGFFGLIIMGPLVRDFLAIPLGLGTSGSSVLTAGLVMGIMIIPFVSSLSDDIINAVPQSLRDGSLGLGATKSETIKRVVLPAALPGIVGAVIMAASKAIGETMIVVMAAGVATRISVNPFQEMTTMTVKIISQLTGDTEFTSPQTLVAFALGLTLFVLTLGMNIYALHIVRKYREQYD